MIGIFRRRHLPHWDVPDAAYFVTICLAGSIPATVLRQLYEHRAELDSRPRPVHLSEQQWALHKHKLLFARMDQHLDQAPPVRRLAEPALAAIVQKSMYHFAETRYHLIAYVVMPSHVHWVFHPMRAWCESVEREQRRKRITPREKIQHSLKSFTAKECNAILGMTGAFWQEESYDHWVHDEDELQRIIAYVEQNPVKAGLVRDPVEFRFSSAFDRKVLNIQPGEPLILPPGFELH